MILYLGAMTAPPIVLAINALLIVVLAGAAIAALQSWFGWSGTPAVALALALAVALLFALYVLSFWVYVRLRTRRPFVLDRCVVFCRWSAVPAGPKAMVLARLKAHGLPVAPGLVVPIDPNAPIELLARDIVRFARLHDMSEVIVRSAFAEEDADHPYAGVFASVPHVPICQQAIREALTRVVASRRAPRAKAFAFRLDRPIPEGTATVLVQEQVPQRLGGVMGSFDPSTRRIDEVHVDLFDPDQCWIGRARYQVILDRWTERDRRKLPDRAAGVLLEALHEAERLLGGPVVIEFGIVGDDAIIHQARRLPAVSLIPVWTNTGPVDLSPEPLAPLLADIVFGRDLSFLARTLWNNRLRATGACAVARAPSFTLIHGRPYVDYGTMAETTRFAANVRIGLWHVVAMMGRERLLRRKARGLSMQADSDLRTVRRDLRDALVVQSALEAHAIVWDAWRERFGIWSASQSDDPPWIPWHGMLQRWLVRRAAGLQSLRNRVRSTVLQGLQEVRDVVRERAAAAQPALAPTHACCMRWDEWERFCQHEGAPAAHVLDARAQQWELARTTVPPPIVVKWGDTAVDADFSGILKDTEIALRVFVEGDFEGKAWSVESGLEDGDTALVAILPNHSLRWLPAALEASGVILVGGGLLTHLGLQLMLARKPTVFGLAPNEAAALHGRRVRVVSGRVFVEGDHTNG